MAASIAPNMCGAMLEKSSNGATSLLPGHVACPGTVQYGKHSAPPGCSLCDDHCWLDIRDELQWSRNRVPLIGGPHRGDAWGLTVALSHGVLNIAIPSMMSSLGTDLDRIQWVQTAYADYPGCPHPGRGMARGTARDQALFLLSTFLFITGSVLSGLAWDVQFPHFLPYPPGHRGWPHHATGHEHPLPHLPP